MRQPVMRIEDIETKDGIGRRFPLTRKLVHVLEQQIRKTAELERTKGQVIPWLFHRESEQISCHLSGLLLSA